ncbi:SPOR domain-containing protein [uncultured Nitratireductor sp.]|uniref:SPOR domain-containing protein n=1 Tax=uncultured Nitratireductor sp. TaxID=520953 RepID=UPI0025D9B81F|nr:SPOR domain-containing protein [uncultured Nitratireductor sp.]
MADHSSNQRADSAVLPDDDPFAELTRIMGHDPRRAEEPGNDAEQGGDDLALELENELLGDLAEFSDEVREEPATSDDWQPQQTSDWRFDVQPAAEEVGQVAEQAPVDVASDMADELDESFAASFESEMRLDPAEDVSVMPGTELQSSEPAQAFDADNVEQHFSGFDVDETRPAASDFAAEADQPAEHKVDASVEDVALEFSDQDFAQLDTDLEASLAAEGWREADGEMGETEGMAFQPTPEYIEDEATEDGIEPDFGTGTPDAMSGGHNPAADHVVAETFSREEFTAGSDVAEDVDTGTGGSSSADPYLSPQAFASSVAQGAERSSAVDGDVAREDHDFTASLEEQLTAGALAEEDVAEPVMEPHMEPQQDPYRELDTASDAFENEHPEMPRSPEETGTQSTLSAPFWQQPAQASTSSTHASSMPHIDTVDVPGNERVPVEDARHIPEFVSEPERAPEAEADDLERALARAFGDSESLPETASAGGGASQFSTMPNDAYAAAALQQDEQASSDFDFDTAFADSFSEADQPAMPAGGRNAEPEDIEAEDDFRASGTAPWDDPTDEFSGRTEAAAPAAAATTLSRRGLLRNRRNTMLAAALGGVAVLALIGLFAFGGGGDDNAAPVLVRADEDPVKVKPDNPGGQQVPNQDNQVYQRVSGAELGDNPVQERLVSTAEEPVEVPQVESKSEERLVPGEGETATPTSEPVTAMAPRRVRTMVVRPDGTIVPREPEAPAQTAGTADNGATALQNPASTAQQQASLDTTPDAQLTGGQQPAGNNATNSPSSGGVAPSNVPETAPVPTSRPASPPTQQPAAEAPQPAQVAAAQSQPTQPVARTQAPAPVTSGTDGWSVQISSQPTADAAQKSYQDMAQRYGDLLTGKGVNIVKADIAGKGTYYRVRIPSSSKDDAIRLCSQLKSAGGSCFVSK